MTLSQTESASFGRKAGRKSVSATDNSDDVTSPSDDVRPQDGRPVLRQESTAGLPRPDQPRTRRTRHYAARRESHEPARAPGSDARWDAKFVGRAFRGERCTIGTPKEGG